MACSDTPSSPKDLIEIPFVEFGVKLSEVLKWAYPKPDDAYAVNVSLPFIEAAFLLMQFRQSVKVLEGDKVHFNEFMQMLTIGAFFPAHQYFQQCKGWTLQFGWISEFNDPAWDETRSVYGGGMTTRMQSAILSGLWEIFGSLPAHDLQPTCKTTVKLTPTTSNSVVRLQMQSSDIWFQTLDQGIRVNHALRLADISDGPLTEEGMTTYVNLMMRHEVKLGDRNQCLHTVSKDYSLLENILYNLCLDYVQRHSMVTTFLSNLTFWNNVRSNVPIGAFLGGKLFFSTGEYPVPKFDLNETPGDLYQLLRAKLPVGSQLRQGGLLAAPSTSAKAAGTAAALTLVGKSARTSRRRERLGYRLYDPSTAGELRDALNLTDGAFAAHEVFSEYAEWYREKRALASRMLTRAGTPPPKWGKWGFKPWEFAERQPAARIFIKILQEDS